ncbi:MAG: hypothetical protein KKD39_00905, partial [Candidatus Altiarchaeota archaeon]|nr:hypothetical protein [Candidatus Altiarchaeota archaeon]
MKDYEINKVFIRDLRVNYYHKGLLNISKDIQGTVDYFKKIVDDVQPEKTVMIGSSMGGYAAILFGTLMNADTVISFVPQTILDKEKHKRGIPREKCEEKYVDLKNVIKSEKAKTKYHIYYGSDREDIIQAERLKKTPK